MYSKLFIVRCLKALHYVLVTRWYLITTITLHKLSTYTVQHVLAALSTLHESSTYNKNLENLTKNIWFKKLTKNMKSSKFVYLWHVAVCHW